MGNSADADQMSPDVASHLGLHCKMKFTITGLKCYMHGDTASLQILSRLFILKANLTEC